MVHLSCGTRRAGVVGAVLAVGLFLISPSASRAASVAPTDSVLLGQAWNGNQAALKTLRARAAQGDGVAANAVGMCAFHRKAYPTALVWFRQAARRGDATGQLNLGTSYLHGWGTQINPHKAAHWLRLAATQGNGTAANLAGTLAFQRKAYQTALTWFRQAARTGDATGQLNLAECYLHGWGTKANSQKAVHWLRLSATQGNYDAEVALGKFYGDSKQGIAWMYKAALTGNPAAVTALARLCLAEPEQSDGMVLGPAKTWAWSKVGIAWVRKAALAGNPAAETRLAQFYLENLGATPGYRGALDRKIDSAYAWLRKASAQHWGPADRRLGDIYYNGLRMAQPHYRHAAAYYERAVKESDLKALQDMGLMFWTGRGGEWRSIVAAATIFHLTSKVPGSKFWLRELLTGTYSNGGLPPGAKLANLTPNQIQEVKALLVEIRKQAIKGKPAGELARILHVINQYVVAQHPIP